MSPTRVEETVTVQGSSVSSVLERIEIAMKGKSNLTVTRPSSTALQLATVVRRLGRRRTLVCSVHVTTESRALVVGIVGELESQQLDSLRAAVLGTSLEGMHFRETPSFGVAAPAQPMTADAPRVPSTVDKPDWFVQAVPSVPHREVVAEPQADAEHTVMRTGAGQPAVVVNSARPLFLALPDGRRLELTIPHLVGRNPTPRPDEPDAARVSVSDALLSKTHLGVGATGSLVWVEDRGSTNGTSVVDASGVSTTLTAHRRATFAPPFVIRAGSSELSVS